LPERLSTPLVGGVQRDNLGVALRTIEVLRDGGLQIPDDAVIAGMARAVWPGRFEVIRRDPTIVLDGAHNVAGAEALARDVEALVPERGRRRLLLGVLADKDVAGIASALAPRFPAVTLCRSASPRALSTERLRSFVDEHSAVVGWYDSVPRAMQAVCDDLRAVDVLFVAGSLTVVAEARRWLLEGHENVG
jgi:dihydrofolate synthase/folylpolyglutamate synthase